MKTLLCHGLTKAFLSKNRDVLALKDVNFSVAAGEFVCIVGPSGCGKSTLLRLIAGLLDPTAGRVEVGGLVSGQRPRCLMIFQEQGLFPWMTVLENAAFGLEMQGLPRNEREAIAVHYLDLFGLGEFTHNHPHELSGGMRQRVAIARAFAAEPDILLMDEPFRALDAQTQLILQEELLRFWEKRRTTVVYVTHDISEAVIMGDRVLIMSGRPGHIREDIPILLRRPRDLTGHAHPKAEEIEWHIWKMLEHDVRRNLSPQIPA